MITIIRTSTLAALRAQVSETETSVLLRARTLALEIGSYLALRPSDTDVAVRKAAEVAKWITARYPDRRDTETRIIAATRTLTDFRATDQWSCCYSHEFTQTADRYYGLLISDTRPAAELSTDQPGDGATLQPGSGETNR